MNGNTDISCKQKPQKSGGTIFVSEKSEFNAIYITGD